MNEQTWLLYRGENRSVVEGTDPTPCDERDDVRGHVFVEGYERKTRYCARCKRFERKVSELVIDLMAALKESLAKDTSK